MAIRPRLLTSCPALTVRAGPAGSDVPVLRPATPDAAVTKPPHIAMQCTPPSVPANQAAISAESAIVRGVDSWLDAAQVRAQGSKATACNDHEGKEQRPCGADG